MKYFISQPMMDKTEEEIKQEREQIISAIKEQDPDAEIIESYFEDYNPDNGCIPLKYLSKSIELLADANIAYFAKGWEEARGCKIEHDCAVAYGITVIEDNTDYKGMNFGQAIEALKSGEKVARNGWNGKGMFVYYVPAGNFESYTEIGKSIADENNLVHYNPYFAIKNVNGTVSTWVPSINDCLAEDWHIVE